MLDNKLRILVADDHKIFRQALVKALHNDFNDAEFGEASNADEIFSLIDGNQWDVLLLDINMPGKSGLEVIADLKSKVSKLPVLVLSMYPEEQFALRALKSGASGYIRKDNDYEELIEAVKKVIKGEIYISPLVEELITQAVFNPGLLEPDKILTDREFEVLLKLAEGKSISEISNELKLNHKTVRSHRAKVLQKLKLKNNSEIALYASRHKLIG